MKVRVNGKFIILTSDAISDQRFNTITVDKVQKTVLPGFWREYQPHPLMEVVAVGRLIAMAAGVLCKLSAGVEVDLDEVALEVIPEEKLTWEN